MLRSGKTRFWSIEWWDLIAEPEREADRENQIDVVHHDLVVPSQAIAEPQLGMVTIFIVVVFLEERSSRRGVYPCRPRLVGIEDMPVDHVALPVE